MGKKLKSGDKCPVCYDTLTKIKRMDLRSDEAKKKWPLKNPYILNCRCLHPGDLMVGGFF